jgi:DNA helicase-2/ATP-dependent DNA helicase PcrA
LFRALPDNNQEFHSTERFMDDFKWYMKRNREAFTDEQFTRRLEHGDKILPAYYERYVNEWNKNTLTEHKIKQVEIGGIPVKGDLDKIEFDGKQITIVDYKTGSYENAKAKLKPADEKNPLGGDYWRQAVFYRLLVENDPRHDWEVNSVDFDFIEPYNDEYVKAKVLIKPEDLQIVRNQIKETFENIKKHRFDGCGKEDCNWCTFVRNNFQAPDTLLELAGADENSID